MKFLLYVLVQPLYFKSFDLNSIVTPVKVDKLHKLLEKTGYPKDKTAFLLDGFSNGFSIGYEGKTEMLQEAPYLKITVGSKTELWNKVMTEVKERRYSSYINLKIGEYSYFVTTCLWSK